MYCMKVRNFAYSYYLVSFLQNHIGSLNWGYRVQLREKSVKYINAFAEFIDNHTVKVNELSFRHIS